MATTTRRIVVAVLLLTAQAFVAAYAALIAYLFAVWMVTEQEATRLTPGDWYQGAVARAGTVFLAAVVFGTLLYPLNRWGVAPAVPSHPRAALLLSAAVAVVIAAAGLVGSIQFAIWKPWF